MNSKALLELEDAAARSRLNVLRMLRAGGHGHVGGALSCIDILTALYFHTMNISPVSTEDPKRDRFILSAGHKAMAQYAVLAERGFFDKTLLDTYGELDSHLPAHPNMRKTPGVEANTGALGHGLPLGAGMAAALKADSTGARVFVVTGDGEIAEGSNWEAAAAAAQMKLGNLVLFVDCNGLQISGRTSDVMNMEPLDEKFAAFGWHTIRINGNSMPEIVGVLEGLDYGSDKPHAIIADTVKAKGIPEGENDPAYHFWTPTEEQIDRSIRFLEAGLRERRGETL